MANSPCAIPCSPFAVRYSPFPIRPSIERRIAAPWLAADAGKSLGGRFVVAADVERLGVGAGCLLFVVQPLIGEPAAGPGLDVLRIEQDRVVEVARRGLGIVDREVAQRASDERVGLAG